MVLKLRLSQISEVPHIAIFKTFRLYVASLSTRTVQARFGTLARAAPCELEFHLLAYVYMRSV